MAVGAQALRVQGHDFPADVPRAYPYGIYDVGRNEGFVNVGTDHDTGAFAVASIRGWWRAEGRRLYAKARTMLITADAGGSNGSRLRLWKWELQKFADETGRALSVCHFPPGTSKWNKVEHRLLLVHFLELARRTVARLRDDRQLDRPHDHRERPQGHLPSGSPKVCDGPPNLGRADEDRERRPPPLPRGLELRHQPASHRPRQDLIPLFVNGA